MAFVMMHVVNGKICEMVRYLSARVSQPIPRKQWRSLCDTFSHAALMMHIYFSDLVVQLLCKFLEMLCWP